MTDERQPVTGAEPWPDPLTAEEEAEMRNDLDPFDAYQYGGWAHLVGRLFATLDAAREASPAASGDALRLQEVIERLARQYHGERIGHGGHRPGSWTNCPHPWCVDAKEALNSWLAATPPPPMSSDPEWIPTPFASREEHVQHLARVMRDRAYPEFSHAPTPLWANDAAEAILSEFEDLYRAARREPPMSSEQTPMTDERQPVTAPAGDADFDEMLAGFDRILHDKALQQQLIDAGLLVRTGEAEASPAAIGDALRAAVLQFQTEYPLANVMPLDLIWKALAAAPSDPEPVAGLDVGLLGVALQWAVFGCDIDGDTCGHRSRGIAFAEKALARLSDRRHQLEAERQRQVRENEPEAPA